MTDKAALMDMTAKIVSAYIGNNAVKTSDIPELIRDTFVALESVDDSDAQSEAAAPVPAISIDDSVTDDFIICLEDGKQFKSLKRHIRTHYDLSPEEYREKWDLPKDYPMVAPNYAKARSKLAKQMGLGQARGRSKSV